MTPFHLTLTGYALGCLYLAYELWRAPIVRDHRPGKSECGRLSNRLKTPVHGSAK